MGSDEDWKNKLSGFYDKYGEGIRRNVRNFSGQYEGFEDNEFVRDTLNPLYGRKTEKILDEELRKKHLEAPEETSAFVAPISDMWRSYKLMTNEKLKEADKFRHCEGNYNAARRGVWGQAVARGMSTLKEVKDIFKYPLHDLKEDWVANRRGWYGASHGMTLDETCPRNFRSYRQFR